MQIFSAVTDFLFNINVQIPNKKDRKFLQATFAFSGYSVPLPLVFLCYFPLCSLCRVLYHARTSNLFHFYFLFIYLFNLQGAS